MTAERLGSAAHRHRELSEVEGGSGLHYSLELFLLWVVRVVHKPVVTELARRNNGFTPGKRSQAVLQDIFVYLGIRTFLPDPP